MTTPHYHHFQIEELADGVYAAIATDEGGLLCNSAIVDLGSTTLVLDSGTTLPAARELRNAAEILTGRPVTYLVNSHVHPDHINGNVVFEDATLIASQGTRAAMLSDGARLIDGMRRQLAGRLEGYPDTADLRVPPLSFAGELTFHGTRQTAYLIACGPAHSEGDTVLWLPETSILFTGDLITDGNLILSYGDPEAWLNVLDRLEALAPRIIVPGHGNIAPASDAISRGRSYIKGLLDQVAQALTRGNAEEWAAQTPVPEGCGEYWFRDNLRFLLKRR